MKRTVQHIVFAMLFIGMGSCIDPYEPDIDRYENLLVVDGMITSGPGPYTIKLSRSFAYNEDFGTGETKATVMIIDDLDNTYTTSEIRSGVYETDPGFRGELKRQYKIHIETLDGVEYESEFVSMKRTPDIDRVYADYEVRETGRNSEVKGLQIYLDSHDPEHDTWYYRYEYSETWKFVVPYPINSVYDGSELVPITDTVDFCWQTKQSTDILIASSDHLEEDVIFRQPVRFVSNETNRLFLRYSIEVRQFALSEEAYFYWKSMEQTNQELGTLFDPQPSQVTGNIYNINDPDEPVLGYFEAAEEKSYRIFLDESDLPPGVITTPGFLDCFTTITLIQEDELFLIPAMQSSGNLLIGYGSDESGTSGIIFSDRIQCIDCRSLGTNKKPSYWTDE